MPLDASSHGHDYICESIEGILTEEVPAHDILMIAGMLLKQASWVMSQATLKEIMTLMAVVAYVQLYHEKQSAPG